MQIFQQIITTLTALVMSLSAQVGNITQSINPQTQLAQVVPTSGLVGYWNFNEGSGTVAADSSGNGNNGTINGATWTNGRVGSGALQFDGVNDKVTAGSFSSMTSYTYTSWINLNNTSNEQHIAELEGTQFYIYNNKISNGKFSSNTILQPNQWYFVAITRTPSGTQIYLNGISDGGGVAGNDPWTPTASIHIGEYYSGSNYFLSGIIDEVRIYNRALSISEISDIYNDTGSIPPPTPDTTPPSTPTNLTATAVSSSQINLSWSASTDNIGVTGYDIYKNGTLLTSIVTNSYSNTGLSPSTSYSYTVRSKDLAGNNSAQSSSVSATTQTQTTGPQTYSVKKDGSGNFTTIQACANVAVAGDTCEIYAGSYSGWTQSANGTSGSLITFKTHPGDVVNITDTNIILNNRSYIVIQDFDNIAVQIIGNGSTHHNIIQNNYFTGTFVIRVLDGLGHGASDNVVRNNVINMNTYGGTSRNGAIGFYGDRNIFENNEIYNGAGDAFQLGGKNIIVRGNYFHDLDSTISTEHIDFVQSIGAGADPTLEYSLIEGNVEKNCGTSQCHFTIFRQCSGVSNCSLIGDNIIVRNNYVYNLDGSGSSYGGVGDNAPNGRFYNNTIATESFEAENGAGVSFQNAPNGVVLNNIFYNTVQGDWSPHIYASFANKNIVYTSGYSGSWNSYYSVESSYNSLKNLNPLFANYPANASLQSFSPAIDTGGSLTSVAIGDSGNGTTLLINDVRFFQSGWAGASADWIAVGSPTNVAQIASISYPTNTITLASPISRSSGQPVYLYKDSSSKQVLYGSAPDIGAYEYTGTITPPPTSTKFTTGQRVQTTSNVNVRATASASGTLLGTQSLGALGTIVSGGQSVDGYFWWNVNYDSGVDGYSVENYLTAYSTPIVGDFNSDGLVNSIDLSLLTSAWNTNNSTYDLNHDNLVNSLDYVIMVQNWSL